MKRETIERLSMDLSAGQLNEDVQALLSEYIAEHPETNKWLLDIQEIYKKTDSAISAKIAPAGTAGKIKLPLKFKFWPIARQVAVIIFAAFIGASIGRCTKKPVVEIKKEYVQVLASSPQIANRSGFNIDNLGEGFWRDKITAILNPSPAKVQTSYNNGTSLFELLERYRQYIKEKHYE